MKKYIKLTESQLERVVKNLILESNYETQYDHSLKSSTGKSYSVKKGSIWYEKKIGQKTYWTNKNTGLYFTCDGKNIPEFEEEDLYGSMNINQHKGSNSLVTTMKSKLCKK
jgi:hypothetical protein